MSNFINITSNNSKSLHEPIFKNAQKLKKDALIIAETNKSFSTANSLLILSSEEVIKAILVLLHSEEFDVYKIKDAKKFFSDHKIRHQLAQLLELVNGLVESGIEFENNERTKVDSFKNETFNEVFGIIKDLVKAAKPFIKSGERINALKVFNDNKNKGLYTDYRETLLIPSQVITEEVYYRSNDIVERIFKTYKILRLMHNPMIQSHIKHEKIMKYKNQIKEFVNGLIQGIEEIKKIELKRVDLR